MRNVIAGLLLAVLGGCSSPAGALHQGEKINAIWGSAPNNVYAVGTAGLIRRYDGTTWIQLAAPTHEDLIAVWGASADEIYVSAADGLYRSLDAGATWEVAMAPTAPR